LKTCGDLSLAEVELTVRKCLVEGQLAGALDAVRDAADTVINNQRSVARIYASRHLDKLCEEVAQAVLRNANTQSSMPHSSGGTVILATELAAAGGHVEVIKDLVRLGDMPQPVELLLTDNFRRIVASAQQSYADAVSIPLHVATGANSGDRLRAALTFLAERRPHTVVLLVHNQDATGVVAGLACAADKVVFVHHGDHHLSLGVTCPAFGHVDLSNFAFFNCRHVLGIANNKFWPLTLASEKTLRHDGVFLRETNAVTCCVGRPEKFDDPGYQYQYLDLIGLMLRSTGGRHVHIGPLSSAQLQRMHQSLQTHGVHESRLKHVPWVSSVSRALIENGVDLYITSFPYGGGKAQVEAMATGLPVLVHKNYRSRFLSGIDIGYPGTMQWSDDVELKAMLSNLTSEWMNEHARKARTHFEQHHSEEAFRQAMRSPSTRDEDVPPLAVVHNDGLQAFLDEERNACETNAQREISRLQDLMLAQSTEMRILLKKARFLGSARYKITMAWKNFLK